MIRRVLVCLLPALLSGIALSAPATKREPLPTEPPESLKAELDVVYGETPEQVLKLDVYRPKDGGDKLPACILIHGGGWVKGDKERFRPLAIALAQKGYVVANIEYRLGPVAKYPAAVQDCNLAVRFMRANAGKYGLDPERIGAWGGSAGGHLAGMLAAAPIEVRFLSGGPDVDVSAAVQATVVMAGPMDLATEATIANLRKQKEKSFGFQWLGKLYDDAPELYKEASPIHYLSKDTKPILFLTGSLDNPGRDEAAMAKLRTLGVATRQVVLPDAKHGCWLQRPWFEECVNVVDNFFKEHLKRP